MTITRTYSLWRSDGCLQTPLALSVQVDGKRVRKMCAPAKVHNIYNTTLVLLSFCFFVVDHDNDVPVVQVLILCLSTKDRRGL